jgi:hypothetical protein
MEFCLTTFFSFSFLLVLIAVYKVREAIDSEVTREANYCKYEPPSSPLMNTTLFSLTPLKTNRHTHLPHMNASCQGVMLGEYHDEYQIIKMENFSCTGHDRMWSFRYRLKTS